ncbi:MAG TPA: guanylate kinase [Gaiellaceae bacterium]|nr:guanylate kinase [Gaiellaceae bacterium]
MPSSSASDTGPVIVVTGTSGAGKGTIERILLERHPELELAVSATTRERRPNEVDGKHYWFLTDEEFDRRLEEKGFLEYVTFPWGQRSGTLRSEIDRIQAAGRVPLLDLETDGALYVQKRVRGAVTIFITAPTFEELERRLRERATESAGEIGERLRLAREQLELAEEFDHVIVNDDLARAAAEAQEIVREQLGRRTGQVPLRP